jgi:hypothetical protein
MLPRTGDWFSDGTVFQLAGSKWTLLERAVQTLFRRIDCGQEEESCQEKGCQEGSEEEGRQEEEEGRQEEDRQEGIARRGLEPHELAWRNRNEGIGAPQGAAVPFSLRRGKR